jgi:hypothetical protein
VACLLSDARAGLENDSFEAFCSEFGYDTDSRTAERTYNACRDCAAAMQRILGDDFDRFSLGAIEAEL